MEHKLVLEASAPGHQGVVFVLRMDGVPVAPLKWPTGEVLLAQSQEPACPGALTRLIDEGLATIQDQSSNPGVLVPHSTLAGLPAQTLSCLGLPPLAPYVLAVSGNGPVAANDFRFRVRFVGPRGIPAARPRRVGAFLETPGKTLHVLPAPFYELLEAIDEFERERDPLDQDDRLAMIGHVLELLPQDARVDDVLKTIHIRWCDAFTLQVYRNISGEPDFDPVPLVRPRSADDENRGPEPALKGSRQKSFERYFRERSVARSRYPAGNGWYVVFSPPLKRALGTVRSVQQKEPKARLEFLRNPHAFIREKLGGELAPEKLETLFMETPAFSERVREIGAWLPPSLPFYSTGTEWLPPAEVPHGDERGLPSKQTPQAKEKEPTGGVRIGEIHIPSEQVPEVQEKVGRALEAGQDYVKWNELEIPVTRQVYRSLETARERTEQQTPPVVLLIEDNLEEVHFRERFRQHGGVQSGTPGQLRSTLFPHQEVGIEWLQAAWLSGVPGTLLADDMGLGKTLQVLSFFAWLREMIHAKDTATRFLVVGPTALIRNWIAEMEIHFEEDTFGKVIPLQGSVLRELRLPQAAPGKEIHSGLPLLDVVRLKQAGVVLTSYETLRDYQHSLGGIRWTAMALDEAQKIKNPATLASGVARAMNAEFVIAMTGTPVENRMADLWSILDATRPGKFGALREFVREYEGDPEQVRPQLEALGRHLAEGGDRPPIMIRRLKEDHVKGLPAINYQRMERTMPEEQAQVYDGLIQEARNSGLTRAGIITTIQRLRAASLHPALIREDCSTQPELSARFLAMMDVLNNVSEQGEKALIFVDSRHAQDFLVDFLADHYSLPQRPFVINGAVPGTARKSRIDQFLEREGFDVLILSPKAAGIGLNLVEANHVIHLARWWNPAVEDQATDRAYRIGQRKDVHVYLPLAIHPRLQKASFDLRLDELLERKRFLHQTLLAPAAASKAELQDFFENLVAS